MDIFSQLAADHRRQRRLIESILAAALDDQARLRSFEELCGELMAHAAAEEQTLYAELLAHCQQQIQQSVTDHDGVAELMFELQKLEAASPEWLAGFEMLTQKVERHLKAEETLLLPLARSRIKRRRAKLLGRRFEQLKQTELAIWTTRDPEKQKVPDRKLSVAPC